MPYKSIEESVLEIKNLIEDSIRTGGVEAKNNLIRTQIPICLLHDAAKASFIANGVNADYIRPAYGSHNGEMKVAGFLNVKIKIFVFFPIIESQMKKY